MSSTELSALQELIDEAGGVVGSQELAYFYDVPRNDIVAILEECQVPRIGRSFCLTLEFAPDFLETLADEFDLDAEHGADDDEEEEGEDAT
jgi:hypothetical protein